MSDERIAGTVSDKRCHECNALMINRGKTHRCPDCNNCYPIFQRIGDGLVHNTLSDDYPVKVQEVETDE
jgi:DNA-directed RNA polymerase subunit M/transcription elongation factor TFIIS